MDTRIARQLLAELELISHGSVQSWNPSGGGRNAERDDRPTGESDPPHLQLRTELAKALTQTQVDKIAEKARTALRNARYAPERRHVRGTLEWRQAIAKDERTAKDVAKLFDVSERTVYYYRKEYRTSVRSAA